VPRVRCLKCNSGEVGTRIGLVGGVSVLLVGGVKWQHAVLIPPTGKLVDLDSNQDKQNQNLLCYHYTIDQ